MMGLIFNKGYVGICGQSKEDFIAYKLCSDETVYKLSYTIQDKQSETCLRKTPVFRGAGPELTVQSPKLNWGQL